MIRAAISASPAVATTCDEYVSAMRAEGIRTLVVTRCVQEADVAKLDPNWNFILESPAGACLTSRLISGDKDALAFAAYLQMMNEQKDAKGCPATEHAG